MEARAPSIPPLPGNRRLSLDRLIAAASAYAAMEFATALIVGRFFAWQRAEALLFFAFRPWLALAGALLISRYDWRSRGSFYGLALLFACLSQWLFLRGLGASGFQSELLRGAVAGLLLWTTVDLLLQVGKPLGGRWGLSWAALAVILLYAAGALRPYQAFVDPVAKPPSEKPRLLLMTGLPLIWGENGAFDPASRPALAYRALQTEYEVKPLDTLEAGSLAGGRLLLLAQPRALRPSELVALDAWVRQGGRALILTDPFLAWPSRLPLGDVRRPPPVGLLAPLLDHWGLRLDPPDRPRMVEEDIETGKGARRLRLIAPGRFAALGPACGVGNRPYLARCRPGQGEALLIADADLIHDRAWAAALPNGGARPLRIADNLLLIADLLDRLAGADRPRAAGEVRWLRDDADRWLAIALALAPLAGGLGAAGVLRLRRKK